MKVLERAAAALMVFRIYWWERDWHAEKSRALKRSWFMIVHVMRIYISSSNLCNALQGWPPLPPNTTTSTSMIPCHISVAAACATAATIASHTLHLPKKKKKINNKGDIWACAIFTRTHAPWDNDNSYKQKFWKGSIIRVENSSSSSKWWFSTLI